MVPYAMCDGVEKSMGGGEVGLSPVAWLGCSHANMLPVTRLGGEVCQRVPAREGCIVLLALNALPRTKVPSTHIFRPRRRYLAVARICLRLLLLLLLLISAGSALL